MALAAPVLVSLGHDPVASISACLLFNTLATVYGAAGTPLSYGFDGLGLSDEDRVAIGLRSAALLAAAAAVVPPLALCILVGLRVAVRSGLFVAAAVASFVVPMAGLAAVSIEFPALLGGLISVAVTTGLAWTRVGLADEPPPTVEDPRGEERGGGGGGPAGGSDRSLAACAVAREAGPAARRLAALCLPSRQRHP